MTQIPDYPGIFISVEGIDGSGKSTLIEAAEDEIHDVVTTREPAEHLWTGVQTRKAINSAETPSPTDFHLFLADRANHLQETIRPALDAGKTVVTDRYSDSTRAYQQEVLAGDVYKPTDFIEYNLGQPWHLEPDLTILIDISAEESARRTSEGDKYEESAFIAQVRENYLDLAAEHDRILVIDGSKPKDFVRDFGVQIIREAQTQRAEVALHE